MSIVERLTLPPQVAGPDDLASQAAVAVIFGPEDELLFIQRAERRGDPWSGHMAFPGGRAEPVDPSPRHTAQRETREEVGLDLSDARFLGALPMLRTPMRDPVRGVGVFPYVWQVPAWPELFTPSDEVAGILRVPFDVFRAGRGRGEFRYQAEGFDLVLPCVDIGERRIWGLTLRMLDDLVSRVPGVG